MQSHRIKSVQRKASLYIMSPQENLRRGIHSTLFLVFLLLGAVVPSRPSASPPPPPSTSSRVPVLTVDQARLDLGEAKLRELEGQAQHSPCWREAVCRLNSSCKLLSDVEQSKLAVAFANCHLGKSGRTTYPCTDEMSVAQCTRDMDHDAFSTYTHFFTHTGHICYFLQIELWQEHTEGLVERLSKSSGHVVEKLEQSLHYHRDMQKKQDTTLSNQDTILEQDRQIATSLQDARRSMEQSFDEMSEMAEKQKALLGEMFGSLQSSVDAVHRLMSLMLVEVIGYETVAVFVISWIVVLFLPQFRYSRFKLYLCLIGEAVAEVCIRRVYGYVVLARRDNTDDMSGLHSLLWSWRYVCGAVSILLYVWEWSQHLDYGLKNNRLLEEIRQLVSTMRNRKTYTPQPHEPLGIYPGPQPGYSEDAPDSKEDNYHHVTADQSGRNARFGAVSSEGVWSDDEFSSPREPDNDLASREVKPLLRSQLPNRHLAAVRAKGPAEHFPSPYTCHSPTPFKHHSPVPSVHHSPAPSVHHSPTPFKHHSPAPSVHHSATPFKHHSPAPSIHQLSSDEEEEEKKEGQVPLIRSPINKHTSATASESQKGAHSKKHIMTQRQRRSLSRSRSRGRADDADNVSPGNRLDPELEKEVMEEKKVSVKKSGTSRRSQIREDASHHLSTTQTPHRYNLRARTPQK